jgi:hypothetical protein
MVDLAYVTLEPNSTVAPQTIAACRISNNKISVTDKACFD